MDSYMSIFQACLLSSTGDTAHVHLCISGEIGLTANTCTSFGVFITLYG